MIPAVAAAVLALLTPGLVAGPAAGAPPSDPWREVLQRAARATLETTYVGEALWVTHVDGQDHVARLDVRNVRGDVTVAAADRYAVTPSDEGGGLTHYEEGWTAPLPPAEGLSVRAPLDALAEKYEVTVSGTTQLLDRWSTVVEIVRRSDGLLRERLWVDDETGLVLRRETYADGEEPVRMAVYLALDIDPRPSERTEPPRAARFGVRPGVERDQDVTAVGSRGLAALREAGYTVPEQLPGGYAARGMFAVSSTEGQPLQVVYGDGLYSVSLFQQPGRPDWESLPAGAEPAADVGFRAYEWPGAVPARLVWEADGTTWSLVGDAPPDEFVTIAQALPHPSEPGVAARLVRGLQRLWSWASPWN